jgi:uncharacterized protein (DUF362 family)
MVAKNNKKCRVALRSCNDYERGHLKGQIDLVCRAAGLSVKTGSTVLLKPNLVAAGRDPRHLACSSPEFVAAAAEWCLDHGARLKVGDSPAFGRATAVMRACGMTAALRPLGVELLNFTRSRALRLNCGITVPVAVEALDCDLLLNLPRVKAHNQLYVSLAVKNYFGVVAGWRKALHHAINGDVANRFEELLADLPGLFPATFSLLDGIVAMHRTGPMRGEAFPLRLIGAAANPVALDSVLLRILKADFSKSRLWTECRRRAMLGTDPADLAFPLMRPADFSSAGFILPDQLKPVTFHPARMVAGACRRLATGIFPD